MDRWVVAVLAEGLPNPAAAVAVANLPGILVVAFGSKAVVGVGPGMAVPILEVVVPSHQD